jgi:hypothetical protein
MGAIERLNAAGIREQLADKNSRISVWFVDQKCFRRKAA